MRYFSRWLVVILLASLLSPLAQADNEAPFLNLGLDPAKVSLPKKQGSILGLSGVSVVEGNQGQVRYTYPLPIPEWRGLLPELALVYDSSHGNGLLGQGFIISLPFIERDQRMGVPESSTPFRSSLDGELIDVSTGIYRARIESAYHRYKYSDNKFVMETGQGITYLFNKETAEADTELTTRWWLSEIKDQFGNRVELTYDLIGNVAKINQILFRDANSQQLYRITFDYVQRPDKYISYRSGIRQDYEQRLNSIRCDWLGANASERVFSIHLEYASGNGRSLLEKIRYFGRTDEDAAPIVTFRYSKESSAGNLGTFQTVDFHDNVPRMANGDGAIVDFNGDGLPDILARNGPTVFDWHIWYNSNGVQFSAEKLPTILQGFNLSNHKYAIADVNGDRRVDLITKSGFSNTSAQFNERFDGKYAWAKLETVLTGLVGQFDIHDFDKTAWVDLDADSRADFVWARVPNDWAVFHNKPPGFIRNYFSYQDFPVAFKGQRFFGDVNGDGLPDLIKLKRQPTPALLYLPNNGKGWMSPTLVEVPLLDTPTNGTPSMSDLNGDGLSELILWNKGSTLQIYQQTSNGFEEVARYSVNDAGVDWNRVATLNFGDINGNGSLDVILTYTGDNSMLYADPYEHADIKTPYLMTGYSTEDGEAVTFSYRSSAETNDQMPVTYQVVASRLREGTGFTQQLEVEKVPSEIASYEFHDGRYDEIRNEFLGYGKVLETHLFDPEGSDGIITETLFHTDKEQGLLKGKAYQRTIKSLQTGDFEFRHEKMEWSLRKLFDNADVSLPLQMMVETTSKERDGSQHTARLRNELELLEPAMVPLNSSSFSYDEQGRLYREQNTKYVSQSNHLWLVNLPSEKLIVDHTGRTEKVLAGQRLNFNLNLGIPEELFEGSPGAWEKTAKFKYDQLGNIVEVTDALNRVTEIGYGDGFGFKISNISQHASPAAEPLKKRFQYDFTVGGKMAAAADENGYTTRFRWDGLARLTGITPAGLSTETDIFEYEFGTPNRLGRIFHHQRGIEIPEITYVDALGRDVASTQPGPNKEVINALTVYDPAGRKILTGANIPIAEGNFSEIDYRQLVNTRFDALDRPIASKYPSAFVVSGDYSTALIPGNGNVPKGEARWGYSTQHTIHYNQEGEATVSYQDHFGRLCAIDQAADSALKPSDLNRGCGRVDMAVNMFGSIGRVELTYDPANQITQVQQSGKPARKYAYDTRGRRISVRTDDIGSIEWDYNPVNKLEAVRTLGIAGQPFSTVFHQYDGLDRETEQRSLAGVAGSYGKNFNDAQIDYRFVYDTSSTTGHSGQKNLKGRLAELHIPPNASYFYGYDAQGRQSLEHLMIDNKRFTTLFDYDDLARLKLITYPEGQKLAYHYSPRHGKVITSDGPFNSTVTYDEYMQIAGIAVRGVTTPDNLEQTFSYNPLTLTLKAQKTSSDGQSIASYNHDIYDAMGRLKHMTGQDAYASDINKSYSYDGLGQLSLANLSFKTDPEGLFNQAIKYAYNSAGEITEANSKLYQYERTAKGAVPTIKIGGSVYSYDAFGKLVSTDKLSAIRWNPLGHIASVERTDGRTINYTYLPNKSRFTEIIKHDNVERSTLFVNKYVQYQKETDSQSQYFYIGDKRIARSKTGGEVEVFITDQVQSTQLLSRMDGQITFAEQSLPYGDTIVSKTNGQASPRYGFAGALVDQDFGLHQMGSRYYEAQLGQFLSPDSLFLEKPELCLKDSVSCNLYNYARNNPLGYIDPTGNNALATTWAITQIVAVLIKSDTANAPGVDGKVDTSMPPENMLGLFVDAIQDAKNLANNGPRLLKVSGERIDKSSSIVAKGLPDNAHVCRGGTCTADRFTKGSGVTVDSQGKLSGVSVNSAPGKSVQELSQGIPNKQVGVTTVGDVRKAGGDVIPSPNDNNLNHCTLCGITPQKAEKLFTPTINNPNL